MSAPGIEQYKAGPDRDRAEWMRLRGKDITASVAGALFGVHPYTTRYELWMRKAGKAPRSDAADNAATMRGRVLEKPALDLLQIDRPKWKVWQPELYFRDPAARLGATPDAFAVDPARPGFGNVQVKSVEQSAFRRGWFDESGEIEVPLWIAIQANLEAHLAGASWACVIAFVVGYGLDLHIVEVPLHAGIIRRLEEESAEFWRSLKAGEAPDPDYGRDGALLAGMYAEDNGREVDLSRDNMLPALLDERAELLARMKDDKARVAEIDAEVIHKIGDHERAFLPGWQIKRPLVKRDGFYVSPTEYRRLSIRKLK